VYIELGHSPSHSPAVETTSVPPGVCFTQRDNEIGKIYQVGAIETNLSRLKITPTQKNKTNGSY